MLFAPALVNVLGARKPDSRAVQVLVPDPMTRSREPSLSRSAHATCFGDNEHSGPGNTSSMRLVTGNVTTFESSGNRTGTEMVVSAFACGMAASLNRVCALSAHE